MDSGGHAFDARGTSRDSGAQGFADHASTPLSSQLQTDYKTLHTDQKTLQAEIPASLTAAVKADLDIIHQAFAKLTPTQMQALHSSGTQGGTISSESTSSLTAALTAAGVSSSEINTITTDVQNLKNAYTTTDLALQAKIAADKAAIGKDGGLSFPVKGPDMPGIF